MLMRRIIACLDVAGTRVVKGTRFVGLRDVGDPAALARAYEADGADELVLLDISATPSDRETRFDVVARASAAAFIPLTLGGGIRGLGEVEQALASGADKVALNSAAVACPALLGELAARFGSQCIVASIDARAEGGSWRVVTHGGRRPLDLDAVEWARRCAGEGAGEILLTSIDRDGTREGYDLALTRAVSAAVSIPVVASGGAGTASHVVDVLLDGAADAALLAGILHDGTTTIDALKRELHGAGIATRMPS